MFNTIRTYGPTQEMDSVAILTFLMGMEVSLRITPHHFLLQAFKLAETIFKQETKQLRIWRKLFLNVYFILYL